MNEIENRMLLLLSDMRDLFGVRGVKAEFESEGARLEELMRLKDIASRANLPIILKIGGPEAVRDMLDASILGVSCVVAPMVESAYALRKFLEAAYKHLAYERVGFVDLAINIETVDSVKNFDAMLLFLSETDYKLNRITIGRTDLCGSLGLGREGVNSPEVMEICEEVFKKAKNYNLTTTLGGSISKASIDFIERLAKKGLLDNFETRKVCFGLFRKPFSIERGLMKALELELLWLENKRQHYSRISGEDLARIERLAKLLS